MKNRFVLNYRGETAGGEFWWGSNGEYIQASKTFRMVVANAMGIPYSRIIKGSHFEFIVRRVDLKKK